jgi:gamma-glutamyltranspeptidase/glutathione hydrolase
MSVKEAVEAPRIHAEDNLIRAEKRVPRDRIDELRRMGHHVEVRRPSEMYFGGVHAALVKQEAWEFEGGADPRRDGIACGY